VHHHQRLRHAHLAAEAEVLGSFSATKNVPAIRNDCVIPLTYDEVTPGPRNAQAVTALARVLHPTAFGLPSRTHHGYGNHSH
jgi:ABC-type Fe3+-hydroxamate transport system substrate-binding protein